MRESLAEGRLDTMLGRRLLPLVLHQVRRAFHCPLPGATIVLEVVQKGVVLRPA